METFIYEMNNRGNYYVLEEIISQRLSRRHGITPRGRRRFNWKIGDCDVASCASRRMPNCSATPLATKERPAPVSIIANGQILDLRPVHHRCPADASDTPARRHQRQMLAIRLSAQQRGAGGASIDADIHGAAVDFSLDGRH